MNIKTLRFITLVGMALIGITLGGATPAPAKRVGTVEAPVPPASDAADEAAIRAVYLQKIEGWNNGSGAGFAAAFTEDADLVTMDGTHLKGRQEIASFHQQLFDKFLNGSRLEGQIKSVRFLSPDVALMHTVARAATAHETETSQVWESIQTLVVTKGDGKWRIATSQNSRVDLEHQTLLKPTAGFRKTRQ